MGLEITGFAQDHFDSVWIDPLEYKDELLRAVQHLSRSKINVSIYNVPLCLLDESGWKFAAKSISQWKNCYLPICENCLVLNDCCGFFATSGHVSSNVKPISH